MKKQETIEQVISSIQTAIKTTNNPAEISELTDKIIALIDRLNNDNEKLWSLEEASLYLQIKPDTLRKFAAQKKIPHIKVGSLTRFDPFRLKKWALSRESKIHEVWR